MVGSETRSWHKKDNNGEDIVHLVDLRDFIQQAVEPELRNNQT